MPIKSAFPPGVTRIIWKAGAFHGIFTLIAIIAFLPIYMSPDTAGGSSRGVFFLSFISAADSRMIIGK